MGIKLDKLAWSEWDMPHQPYIRINPVSLIQNQNVFWLLHKSRSLSFARSVSLICSREIVKWLLPTCHLLSQSEKFLLWWFSDCLVSWFHTSPPGSCLLLKRLNLSSASKIVLFVTCSEIFNEFRIPNTFARYAKEVPGSESMKHWSRIHNFSYRNISNHKSSKTHNFITSMLLCEAEELCVQTQPLYTVPWTQRIWCCCSDHI